MKNNVILALSLSVALVGCGSKSSGGGGYAAGGTMGAAAPASTAQNNNNNNGLLTVPVGTTTTTTATAPTISGITPNQALPGAVVTITGTNFVNLSDVQLGGISLINCTYAATEIQGTVGNGNPGVCDVVVLSPNGNATLSGAFTYLAPNAAPSPSPAPSPAAPSITYTNTISGIFSNDGCLRCHGGSGGVTLSNYSGVVSAANSQGSSGETLVQAISAGGTMAPGNGFGNMSSADAQTVINWVNAGAPQ